MANKTVLSNKIEIVKKSEALVKARYTLSPLALKLITAIIAGLDKNDEIGQEYIFPVKDFADMLNVSYGEFYNEMKGAVDELLKKPLHIDTDTGWIKANWISDAEYVDGKGIINFTISKKLRPYLLAVQEKYLQYDIQNILQIKSQYVIRLYELLRDWFNQTSRYSNSKKVEKISEVEWLRNILEIPNSYQYSSGIKLRILEKAKKELAEKTDIIFDYEEIKTGRKVTHLKFIIEENPKKIESRDSFDFLQSKQRFIAYIRKNYQNKVFRVIDYGEIGKASYYVGQDNFIWVKNKYDVEKLPAEHIDTFFDNTLKEAQQNKEYASLLAKKVEIE